MAGTLLALATADDAAAACRAIAGVRCQSPEAQAILLPAAGPSSRSEGPVLALSPTLPMLVKANFGLLYPGGGGDDGDGGGWSFVCDERYAGLEPRPVKMHPDGRVFAGGEVGLAASADGCQWRQAAGEIAGQRLLDLDFDRQRPDQIWALVGVPASLHHSADGGASFVRGRTPEGAEAYLFSEVAVAPANGRTLYLVGYGRGLRTFVAASDDGAESWRVVEISAGIQPPPRGPLELVAVAPDAPQVVFFSLLDPEGDQLWRSLDGGRSVARVLTLSRQEAFAGLAFGATGQTVYVAGRQFFAGPGEPPGHLYVSRDGAGTWQPALPAGARGPRYQCLASAGGRLYACGAGEIGGDDFLVGVSEDEGQTWRPVVRLGEVKGAKACARASCTATEDWLCLYYRRCARPSDAGWPAASVDAGGADAAVAEACGAACRRSAGACGFSPSAPGPSPGAAALVLLAGVLLARVRAGSGRRR